MKAGEYCLPVSVSAGVAACPEDGSTSVEVLQNADKAVYAAKALGKNRVHRFADPYPGGLETRATASRLGIGA